MKTRHLVLATLVLALLAQSVAAIQPGTDVFVTASARTTGKNNAFWLMHMYIFNPGSVSADVTIYWLVRNAENTSPQSVTKTIGAGDTLVLEDLILAEFGLTKSLGAIRVVSDRAVVVNATSLNTANNTEYGQGVEAIPAANATTAGGTTHVIGLKDNDDYRTNITLIDVTGQGSTATVELIDTLGTVIGSKFYTLRAYEPIHESVTILNPPSFADATLRVTVQTGAVLTGASRVHGNVNEGSGDPITLNPWWQCGGSGTTAGEYFGILETDRMRGIRMTVRDNDEVLYLEFESDHPSPSCDFFFPGGTDQGEGIGFDPPIPLASFLAEGGLTFWNSYDDLGVGGVNWTVELEEESSGLYYTGTVTGVGSGMTGDMAGCNGSFSIGTATLGKNPSP